MPETQPNRVLQFVRALPVGVALCVWLMMSVSGMGAICASVSASNPDAVGCRIAQAAFHGMYLGSLLVVPALAVVVAVVFWVYWLITSGLVKHQRPAGVTLSAVFLGWLGVAALMGWATLALLLSRATSQAPENASWIGLFMAGLALIGCVLLIRLRKTGWQLALAFLAASLGLTVHQWVTGPAMPLHPFFVIGLVGKLVVLFYLLMPPVRALFDPTARGQVAGEPS